MPYAEGESYFSPSAVFFGGALAVMVCFGRKARGYRGYKGYRDYLPYYPCNPCYPCYIEEQKKYPNFGIAQPDLMQYFCSVKMRYKYITHNRQ